MAVLSVVKFGDQVLRKGVERIDEVTPELRQLADDMIDTMRDGETRAVGLAAPQIGRAIALIVAEPPPDHEGKEALHRGAVVLFNPEIVFSSGHEVIEEGCVSCPGATADVERPSHVIIKGMDLGGNGVKLEVDGALSRIFQHEVDHLLGKFFFDRINPIKRQLVKSRIRRT